MVEIVGKDAAAKKRVTCKQCSSILEYVPAEVREVSGSDISGTGYTQGRLKCPCCGHDIVLWER